MKIEIGRTLPDGKSVRLDLAKLVDSRALITANSGGGKSWLMRLICEQCAPHMQVIVIDPEGEFASLREKFDFLLVSKDGEIKPEPRAAGLLARKLAELHVSAVIDLYEPGSGKDVLLQRREFIKNFCDSIVNLPKALWHPMLIMIDESQMYAPEKSEGDAVSTRSIIDLMSLGRKRGFCGVPATSRISQFHKDAAAPANNIFIGRAWLDTDQKRCGKMLGLSPRDAVKLRELKAGEFYAFGPALDHDGVIHFKVNDVVTTHPKAGQRHKLTPPKASEAVKQIAAQLADLPQQAEAEIRSMDDARRRIKELEREARARPVVEKPVETVKRVEVPVVGIRQIQRLESAVAAMAALHESLNGHCKKIEDSYAGVGLRAKEIQEALKAARREGEKQPTAREPIYVDGGKSQNALRVVERRPQKTLNAELIARDSSGPLPVGENAILSALIQYNYGLRRNQLTVLTGYKRSTRDAYIARLKEKGFCGEDHDGRIVATQEGIAALPDAQPLPSGAELQEHWRQRLPEGERRILEILLEAFPNPVEREQLTETSGYKRSTRDAYLSRLESKELVEQAGRGAVRASANLFDVEAVR